MTELQQREAAREILSRWKEKGKEDEDARSFWIELLSRILGMTHVTERVEFEKKVKGRKGGTKRIDVYIPETRVLIEQKSRGIALDNPQAAHQGMTPYEQAKEYDNELPLFEKARWIVTSNFAEIWIYDMNVMNPAPVKLKLEDLPGKYHMLDFLVNQETKKVIDETDISIKAGALVGKIYDAFLKQYEDPESDETLKSLNKLCVRIVFCLYGEDAGIFGRKNMFHDYMAQFDSKHARRGLEELFRVLHQKDHERRRHLSDDDPLLAEFPYVNGGLFEDDNIDIPPFTDEILSLILREASDGFDWSDISPTIFGAVFESTLNPTTRREGGMHYTSIENIHKVIDPLFLDVLKTELGRITEKKQVNERRKALIRFQQKLGSLTFLDPACGSGNFLTETYLSLRELENRVIKELYSDQVENQLQLHEDVTVMVGIDRFFGIEINDFAVAVAKTALWIAENQMLQKTAAIIHDDLDFLPLTTNAFIKEENALRVDWNTVVDRKKLHYIIGNPPYVYKLTEKQKEDRKIVFSGKGGELDYVACWYKKAAEFIENTAIRCAFVSTNSICQGLQVGPLWKSLCDAGVVINFAYKTFRWDSEANDKAHVHCIIISFSKKKDENRLIFDGDDTIVTQNINCYLLAAPDVFIERRTKPIFDVPEVIKGFQPTDHGYLLLSDEEKEEFVKNDPKAEALTRPFISAREYMHGIKRWCLWLVDATPKEINSIPIIKERVVACRQWRSQQKKSGDAYKLKDTPTLMRPCAKYKGGDYIVLPLHTGETRQYVPFGFIEEGNIPGNSVSIIPQANLYHFGILESNVHMDWMRVVCGRIKSDYRYSSDIVYNNFPWPEPTDDQKAKIEQTAQAILDARAQYSDSSLADLYDESTMPIELRKAHEANDRAVMKAYGFKPRMSASEVVAELMKQYVQLTQKR